MEEVKSRKIHGRVRKNTREKLNRKIDYRILTNIRKYRNYSHQEIAVRLEELRKEWDIEKMLEVNASALALTGIVLSATVSKKWLILPGIVTAFLLQHGLQGWCPPLPVFRAMGIRSRHEIDEEMYALKITRGDFNSISSDSHPDEILNFLRKKQ
jgi:hypothetical protein